MDKNSVNLSTNLFTNLFTQLCGWMCGMTIAKGIGNREQGVGNMASKIITIPTGLPILSAEY